MKRREFFKLSIGAFIGSFLPWKPKVPDKIIHKTHALGVTITEELYEDMSLGMAQPKPEGGKITYDEEKQWHRIS